MVLTQQYSAGAKERLSGRVLSFVLLVALVARLFAVSMAVSQHGAKWLYTRGVEVGFIASSLLSGHGFASPFGGSTGPTALIAPGFPLFVTGIFRLFGVESTGSAVIIMLLQVVLNLVTIALLMWLANSLSGPRAALLAGLFWACWPPFLWMPTIFWESSFTALFLLVVLSFATSLAEQPTLRKWTFFGLFCGIAALINMALLITFCGIFVWLAVRSFRQQKSGLAVAALMFLLTFAAWPVRNARVFHAFVPLRTTVGLELWMGNHEGSQGYLEEALFPMNNKAELQEYLRVGEIAYDHAKSAQAHAWISAHPIDFALLTLLRVIRFWTGSGSRNGSPIFIVGAVLTTLLGFQGLFLLCKRREFAFASLVSIPLVLFPLPYYITHAEFRYRLVLDPLLTLLSAYTLTSMKQQDSNANASREPIDQPEAQLVA